MITRQQALALGSPCVGILIVCGIWELGQRAVDRAKLRRSILLNR